MSCRRAPVDRDVAVDAGEEGGGGADRLGDGDGVLEQAVAVGLVVDLRRRGVAEARPDLRALAEEAVEQVAQLGVLDRLQQLAQIALEALEGDLRLGGEVIGAYSSARPRAGRSA